MTTLFLDLRDSIALGKQRLPYDVRSILNQFFAEMATAPSHSHGHYAQFSGDGLMVLYGLEHGEQVGARDALHDATLMLQYLDQLNARLADELDAPLRVGIGIYSGVAARWRRYFGVPTSSNRCARSRRRHCR